MSIFRILLGGITEKYFKKKRNSGLSVAVFLLTAPFPLTVIQCDDGAANRTKDPCVTRAIIASLSICLEIIKGELAQLIFHIQR